MQLQQHVDVLRVLYNWCSRNSWHAAAGYRTSTLPLLRPCQEQMMPACCLQHQQQHCQLRHHNTHAQQRQGGPSSSVLAKEAQKFAALANEWWRTSGPFAPLHRLNAARCKFLRDTICAMHGLNPEAREPFLGLTVLDVGCGGGILSESLARLGATVHGIDITEENVHVAQAHAQQDPAVVSRIRYTCTPLEQLLNRKHPSPSASMQAAGASSTHLDMMDTSTSADMPDTTTSATSQAHQSISPAHVSSTSPGMTDATSNAADSHVSNTGSTPGGGTDTEAPSSSQPPQYDVVVASEVIEHVRRPDVFMRSLSQAVAPGGSLVVSTINRTPASFAVAIVGAEYITRMVPRGTHDWNRFITPQELYLMGDIAGLSLAHAAGMALQDGRFVLTSDLSTNYIVAFHKPAAPPVAT